MSVPVPLKHDGAESMGKNVSNAYQIESMI